MPHRERNYGIYKEYKMSYSDIDVYEDISSIRSAIEGLESAILGADHIRELMALSVRIEMLTLLSDVRTATFEEIEI